MAVAKGLPQRADRTKIFQNQLRRIVVITKSLSIMLAGVLLVTAFGFKTVRAGTDTDAQRSERVRAKIVRVGEGPNARVEVKLRDKTRLKGYVSKTEQDGFTITDSQGASRTLTYADVQEVKKPGGGLSKRSWIIVGASAAAAVLIVGLTLIRPYYCNEHPC